MWVFIKIHTLHSSLFMQALLYRYFYQCNVPASPAGAFPAAGKDSSSGEREQGKVPAAGRRLCQLPAARPLPHHEESLQQWGEAVEPLCCWSLSPQQGKIPEAAVRKDFGCGEIVGKGSLTLPARAFPHPSERPQPQGATEAFPLCLTSFSLSWICV